MLHMQAHLCPPLLDNGQGNILWRCANEHGSKFSSRYVLQGIVHLEGAGLQPQAVLLPAREREATIEQDGCGMSTYLADAKLTKELPAFPGKRLVGSAAITTTLRQAISKTQSPATGLIIL